MEGLHYIHSTFHGIGWLNNIFKFITYLGDIGFVWLVMAFVLLFFKKTRKGAIIMIVSLAVGYVFNNLLLKLLFDRARPFTVNEEFKQFILSLKMELPDGNSFPSGHAFSSFLCAMLLCFYNKKLGFITFPLAFLISLSRIYLCVHYPTDVLAGAVIGIVFAVNMYYLSEFIIKKYKARKRQSARNNVQD